MNLHAGETHLSGDVSVWLSPLSCLVYKHAVPSGLWYADREVAGGGCRSSKKERR